MAIVKRLTKRGFTLIELMIVVVIIGVLASLAIYGVQRYVANSKSAEARIMLGKISKDALTAYEGESMAGTILAAQGSVASTNIVCDSATNLVPTAIIGGSKYQPDSGEFKTGSADTNVGWACLGFSVTTPIYYQYQYEATLAAANTAAVAGDTFTAYARGDLDNDTTISTFSIQGEVVAGTDGGLQMFLAPSFVEVRPEE